MGMARAAARPVVVTRLPVSPQILHPLLDSRTSPRLDSDAVQRGETMRTGTLHGEL